MMDISKEIQRILNGFVLIDCRLEDHQKLTSTVRWLQDDMLKLLAGTGGYYKVARKSLNTSSDTVTSRCINQKTYSIWKQPNSSMANFVNTVRPFEELNAIQSSITVPILYGDSPTGVVSISSFEPDYFKEKHLGKAQVLSALIAYVKLHLGEGLKVTSQISLQLGRALREIREELGFSQSEIAAKLNKRRITLSRWETGAQPPSIGPLCNWCESLGILSEQSPTLVTVVDISPRLISILKEDPSQLKELSPSQFEQLVAERLSHMGYDVTIPSATSFKDGGIDLIAVPKIRTAGSFLIAGQVKHHRTVRKTGREAVDRLLSWKDSPFRLGLLVTNTGFTKDALWLAEKERNKSFLRLRDFDDLKRWLQNNFWSPEDWRELPDKIELAPGVVVNIPKSNLNNSLSIWPLDRFDGSESQLE